MASPEIGPPLKTPYVGPKPFEAHEQNLFFGRDWEAAELVALVIAHPVVLLYAQSGAGKSSLLNAKVLPTLETDEGCEVLPVARVRGDIPANIQETQLKNRYVFNTLMSWLEIGDLTPAQLGDLSIARFLGQLLRTGDEQGYPLLRVLVFDQLEELFTFYPERWPEREQFFQQVGEALAADSFLRVLFVIREDYLAQIDAYAHHLPEQLRSRFRLQRLTAEAALAAVEGPLKNTTRSFAPGVAQELVNELLEIRVEGQAGQLQEQPGEFVEPVQLQVVCQSLWTELPPDVTEITSEDLTRFGNIDQALTRFYEKAIQDTVLATGRIPLYSEWRLRNWFEQEVITPAGTRGLVYRGARKTGSIPNSQVNLLEEHHLIRGESRAGARWYELTHDRFIGPIQKANAAWRLTLLRKWGQILGITLTSVIMLLVAAVIWRPILAPSDSAARGTALADAATAVAAATAAATEVSATSTAVATEVIATNAAVAEKYEATSTAVVLEAQLMSTAAAEESEATSTAEAATAQAVEATSTAIAQATAEAIRKERVRPLRAGLSIGGQNALAGTLGTFVMDDAGQRYILSMADALGSTRGVLVLQPGPFDGGQVPGDEVGRLTKRLPLEGEVISVVNLTALASLNPDIEIDAAVPSSGPIIGIRPPAVGMSVRKLGRSTGWTRGEITAIDQIVPIFLAGTQPTPFEGAIRVTLESSGGDGGALVIDSQGYAIGILVAGTGEETYLAPMQTILDSFAVHLPPPSIVIQDISAILPQNPNPQFPRRSLNDIKRIVLHHTVTSAPVQRIAEAQINRDLPGLTYHYCVTDQGVVYLTQPPELVVSQSKRYGPESLDVCLIGDFTAEPPPQPQLNAAAVLIAQLALEHGLTVDQVYGYKELERTASPGATWETWREELLTKVRDLMASGVSTTVVIPESRK
jgi:hypothetical protein